MISLQQTLLAEITLLVISIVFYYIYTVFVADDFGLASKSNIDTAQNCIYFAVAVGCGFGSRQFEATTSISRSITTIQLIGHFVLLRYSLLAE